MEVTQMKRNVGPTDRIIRIIVGTVIILIGAIFNSWWGLIGIPVFLTGIIGWCGLYNPLKINTCKTKTPECNGTTPESKP